MEIWIPYTKLIGYKCQYPKSAFYYSACSSQMQLRLALQAAPKTLRCLFIAIPRLTLQVRHR